VICAAQGRPQAQAFLTFSLDGREYGVDVGHVREVRAAQGIEPELGIVDLRALLRLTCETPAPAAALIILVLDVGRIGVTVDYVRDVVVLDDEFLERSAAAAGTPGPECCAGIGMHGERRLVLVDIDCALRRTDLQSVLLTARP